MMDDAIHEIIKKFLAISKYSNRRFAALAGINTGTFQNSITRKSKLRADTLLNISNAMQKIIQELHKKIIEKQSMCDIIQSKAPDENSLPMIYEEYVAEVVTLRHQLEQLTHMYEKYMSLAGKAMLQVLPKPEDMQKFIPPEQSGQGRLILKRTAHPIQSDKAVRIVCNMDTELHNLVSKSAEKNNRTFEDELEEIIYQAFEDEENQTCDGYTGLQSPSKID